ncbi:MAG: hypothetical protein IT440_12710 [Phycisphaeraceae bacterium]|nr:hypothetical protein [Phycisphaeraceae bacterium]
MTRLRLFVVVTLSLGLSAPLAMGQYQIDNNLQVGGNQVNPGQAYQGTQLQPGQLGNNIVTGTVTGGAEFRGNVGYSAPGEFHGSTGSDSLYRFRAQSAGSAYSGSAPTGIYYKDSHATDLGSVRTMNPSLGITQLNNNTLSNGIPADPYHTFIDPGQLMPNKVDLGQRPSALGLVREPNGRLLELNASPLMGLRATPLGSPSNAAIDAATRSMPSLLNPTGSDAGDLSTPGLGSSSQLPAGQAYPLAAAPYGQVMATRIEPQNQLQPRSILAPAQTLDQRAAQIDAQVLGIVPSMQARPDQDVFMDIQRQRENQQRVAAGLPPLESPDVQPNNQMVKPLAPGIAPKPQDEFSSPGGNIGSASDHALGHTGATDATESAAAAAVARPGADLPGLNPGAGLLATPQPDAAAEAAKSLEELKHEQDKATDARRVARALPPLATPKAGNDATEDAKANTLATGRSGKTVAPAALPAPAAAADPMPSTAALPDYSIMTDLRNERTARLIAAADSDLQQGRYLDAERKYRNALLSDPELIRARTGLLHAQLGAGMIRAALVNLRIIASQRPELIGYRHEARLLPPANRLAWARQEIHQTVQQFHNTEALLLLAYLNYQTGDMADCRTVLDQAAQQIPTDPMLPLFRKSWLGS